jgi:malate dehydrogenase (oxaloacetate-decarboxylating)
MRSSISSGNYPLLLEWHSKDHISLLDVVINAKPTTLIGVSGQAGAFTEEVVRAMVVGIERPVIFPLSNPTSRSEATPADLMKWTDGRALIGTGSPFAPVEWNGRKVPVDQTNNSYIFPGMGLGILAVSARRVTDTMFMAAAESLAALSPARSGKSERLFTTGLRTTRGLIRGRQRGCAPGH